MNGIISLISFLMCLTLVCGRVTDLGVLIFCSVSVLNVFINYSSFLVESLGESYHLQIWISEFFLYYMYCFISSARLLVPGRTSSTVLNRSEESGHPCLVSDLGHMH